MIVRSKAPLRLGLAGGGTDVSPYCDNHGGYVLNATISLYAHSSIIIDSNIHHIKFVASDLHRTVSYNIFDLPISSFDSELPLPLHLAVYMKIMTVYNNSNFIPLELHTYCDAPPGSGLGSSSTLVVSMIEAFVELLNLPLGEYDISKLAYEVEREDCLLAGGKQDQYAATFGGFNFMEFYSDDRVVINPLRVKQEIIHELESRLLLFYTGVSRDSDRIIKDQIESVNSESNFSRLLALHEVKESALEMKESLLKGNIDDVERVLNNSWISKKQTSSLISNPYIESIESHAIKAGATSMKISGAGGGGFAIFVVDPIHKSTFIKEFDRVEGSFVQFNFTNIGACSWKI